MMYGWILLSIIVVFAMGLYCGMYITVGILKRSKFIESKGHYLIYAENLTDLEKEIFLKKTIGGMK